MPPLLRYDAVRLLEASVEALDLAVRSLGVTKRNEFRQRTATYAIEAGLIGCAAELTMSACIVQALGPGAILWPSGQFKTAGQILDDFRGLVHDATPSSSFLVQGLADAGNHRDKLIGATNGFRLLIPIRAGGLHAGRGIEHEATVVQANAVADFMELLAMSSRIHPYLTGVPRCKSYLVDRQVIVEDLARRLREANGSEQSSALASVFLVLPEVPEAVPEWLDALERVTISPRRRDIEYLLNVLEQAVPATLRRTAAAGGTVPVAVRPDDPDALPISPQFLRRQFNEISDQYHADVGVANGRLDTGVLDPPPAAAIRDIFALGLESTRIVDPGAQLSAHQSWPGIVASLTVQGTPGPYWFLVRRTGDLGQLEALLRRVRALGSSLLPTRLDEVHHGVEAIRQNRDLTSEDEVFGPVIKDMRDAATARERLQAAERRNRNNERSLPADMVEKLIAVAEGSLPVGDLLQEVLAADLPSACLTYWPRMLSEASTEADDRPSLLAVLGTQEAAAGHTAARRALRRIDFSLYGPPLAET